MNYNRLGRPIWPDYDLPLSPADRERAIQERHELLADVDYECVGTRDDPDAYRPNLYEQRRMELLEWIEEADRIEIEARHRKDARTLRRNQGRRYA